MAEPRLIGSDEEVRRTPHLVVHRGADDPITSPMPVVTTLDDRVRCHLEKDVTVVTLDGGLDDELAAATAGHLPGLLANAEAVVVDLDQVTLLEQEALIALVDALQECAEGPDGARPTCLATTRLSGRMVLERWLADHEIAVFGSVADALQARAFAGSGYGTGWTP